MSPNTGWVRKTLNLKKFLNKWGRAPVSTWFCR